MLKNRSMKEICTAAQIETALLCYASEEKAMGLSRFFKTGKGQYGEGDIFWGIKVPEIRSVVKQVDLQIPIQEIEPLLESPVHEVRMSGFLILVAKYHSCRKDETSAEEIISYYIKKLPRANNWDLVDLSAPKTLGHWLLSHERSVLYALSDSPILWEQRAAIVSTFTLIANGFFDDTIALVKKQMHHPHDLMQKANGWMLREIGKRNRLVLTAFLDACAAELPRTTLRYAIEHYSEEDRKRYLAIRQ